MNFILALGRIARIHFVAFVLIAAITGLATAGELQDSFVNPPPAARPWTFWYWNKCAISRAGITADLEAMRSAGLGGAYLMTIKGPDPKLWDPPVVQLTPEWWDMIRHAFAEAERIDLQLAMHVCDGFATAGGPWITPAKSMQKVVWSEIVVVGGQQVIAKLPQPETHEGYYRDIATFAIPLQHNSNPKPKITTSLPDFDASFLNDLLGDQRIRFDNPGWIQYEYAKPFTCRNITIHPDGNSFQANRLLVSVSDDGQNFREVGRLEPPRHGWQNGTGSVTHAIEPTTSRFFRFSYDPAGSEPGAEDLDSAKWKPSLKLRGIHLSSQPRVHQFESKNGSVWRVAQRTNATQLPDTDCVPLKKVTNISSYLQSDGTLDWDAPPGDWLILRMGHTSTGTHNETGGGGKGLECDKFDSQVVKLQFESWFGEIIHQVGKERTQHVLKGFHVDSWECGSQNWSRVFATEFKHRRGYDLLPYLPLLAGIPIDSADVSERILFDVRQTIADLVNDNFFGTLAELAHNQGCWFSAECTAPTMVGDGLRNFSKVDIPMGEFWLRSPTHDKPNDMHDAISSAHIYGKPIIQAEAFTELRMAWDEHPGMLKALSDQQFALGANRLVYHVFNHNPWLDRKPGMTLDSIGLYSQRDQTWWPAAKTWTDYHARCQAMLQAGSPVVDIVVFTGEDVPSRAALPETLVSTLPGIIGKDAVLREQTRLANTGNPQRELPLGVSASANIRNPQDWLDPLRGYAYDSVNADALLRLAEVENGRLTFSGGASYQLLILPRERPLAPHPELITPQLAQKVGEFVQAGATVVACVHGRRSPSLTNYPTADADINAMLGKPPAEGIRTHESPGTIRQIGNGRLIYGPIKAKSFADYGIEPDFLCLSTSGDLLSTIAWNHRHNEATDWYFISNQADSSQDVVASFRVTGKRPELWDPLMGTIEMAKTWTVIHGRTVVPLQLAASSSVFVVFREATDSTGEKLGPNWFETKGVAKLSNPWTVSFPTCEKAENFPHLTDWSKHEDSEIQHFSGTATYQQEFEWNAPPAPAQPLGSAPPPRIWLDLGKVHNLANVKVNGIDCGTAWTPPFRVEITSALHPGNNKLEIAVTNTWGNRLIGDAALPLEKRRTWMTAAYPPSNAELLPAGLLGPVTIVKQVDSP
jgi:hypothetical protein